MKNDSTLVSLEVLGNNTDKIESIVIVFDDARTTKIGGNISNLWIDEIRLFLDA